MGNIIGGIVGGILGKKSGKREAAALRATGAEAAGIAQAGGAEAAGVLDPFAQAGGVATQGILGGLGFGDTGETDAAFQNFLRSTGFRSQLAAGSEAITGNQAARGLLNSGATLKRLTRFGQDLGQQGFTNFLGQLGNVAGRGLTAAGGQAQQIGAAGRAGAGAISQSGQAAAAARRSGDAAFSSGIGQASQGVFGLLGI